MNGNPTPAIKARRRNLDVFSAFLVISFSIGLVRFRQAYKISKALTSFFFHFFGFFLNDEMRVFVARSSPLAKEVRVLTSFFLRFFEPENAARNLRSRGESYSRFAGGWNPKSVCSFSHSQSTNQSCLIEAALSATNVSAFSTLPFKQ